LAHGDLAKDETHCFLCRRTLRDPLRLPPCAGAHHACICLQCFLARVRARRGALDECPVCLADLAELPALLGMEEGYVPHGSFTVVLYNHSFTRFQRLCVLTESFLLLLCFLFFVFCFLFFVSCFFLFSFLCFFFFPSFHSTRLADVRKSDLEPLIDDARKTQAEAREIARIAEEYRRQNARAFAGARRRARRAQLNEVKRLVEQERWAERSEALRRECAAAVARRAAARLGEANRRAQLRLEHTQSRLLSPGGGHRSTLPRRGGRRKGRDGRARSASSSSLGYFEEQDRERRLANDMHQRRLALQAQQAAETDAKKEALLRRAAHKQRQFELRSKHIEDNMRRKLEAQHDAIVEARAAAQRRIAEAQERFSASTEAAFLQHQEKAAEAEARMHQRERRKLEEMQAMAQLRGSVSDKRLRMLEQHRLAQHAHAEELMAAFAEQDQRRQDLREMNAAERERATGLRSELFAEKRQRCANRLEQERSIKTQRANELEDQAASALCARRVERARDVAESRARGREKDAQSLKARSDLAAERERAATALHHSSVDRLAQAETRRLEQLSASVERKKRYLEEIARRKAVATTWQAEARGEDEKPQRKEKKAKKAKAKAKAKATTKAQSMVATAQTTKNDMERAPRELDGETSDAEFLAKVEALRKCQHHQMGLIIDQEESKERERTASVNRSLPRHRAQVAKHFAFKRRQAIERINTVRLSHTQSLEALLKTRPRKNAT
jgi:hypothetical protein